jgi:hypothetical protein
MRELRQSTRIAPHRAVELSGWHKSDLSTVESGSTKLLAAPLDHDPRDAWALVAQTMPDGTPVRPDHVVRKTWVLRNTGRCPGATGG